MNRHEHWSQDALIDLLYGIREGEAEILGCPVCKEEWLRLAEARRVSIEQDAMDAEEIPSNFLAAQRRAVYERLGRSRSRTAAWVPALGTAAALALGVFIYQGQTSVQPPDSGNLVSEVTETGLSDAQLLADVYSIEQSYEPSASTPIRALFEGDALEEGQN